MVTEHAILEITPGREDDFEHAFAQALPLISATPGFVSLDLSRCLEQPNRYLLLVRWERLEDHTEGFRGSDRYPEWQRLLHRFYDPHPTVQHYRAVLDTHGETVLASPAPAGDERPAGRSQAPSDTSSGSASTSVLERIERSVGLPGLAEKLAALPPADLQSVLLAVDKLRAKALSPWTVLAAYESGRFVRPLPLDARRMHDLERLLADRLPTGYELLALSPVCPFGTTSAVAPVDQGWILSSGRNSEVVSDPTNVLALEAALRRRRDRSQHVRLAAAHHVVRAQRFRPGLRRTFEQFVLVSAGRDSGGHEFDTACLLEHVRFHLDTTYTAASQFGSGEPQLRLSLTPLPNGPSTDALAQQVIAPLAEQFPRLEVVFDHERQAGQPGYYVRGCFAIGRIDGDGVTGLGDGGLTDWTARLLSDRKELLMTSGLGIERLLARAPA